MSNKIYSDLTGTLEGLLSDAITSTLLNMTTGTLILWHSSATPAA